MTGMVRLCLGLWGPCVLTFTNGSVCSGFELMRIYVSWLNCRCVRMRICGERIWEKASEIDKT